MPVRFIARRSLGLTGAPGVPDLVGWGWVSVFTGRAAELGLVCQGVHGGWTTLRPRSNG